MKCTDSALGGRSWSKVRVAAMNACAISWPPKVRTGFFARMAADEDVVADRSKLKDVQQFVEIGLSQ